MIHRIVTIGLLAGCVMGMRRRLPGYFGAGGLNLNTPITKLNALCQGRSAKKQLQKKLKAMSELERELFHDVRRKREQNNEETDSFNSLSWSRWGSDDEIDELK